MQNIKNVLASFKFAWYAYPTKEKYGNYKYILEVTEMKVSASVVEGYQILCPLSSMKCDSIFDIEYKIIRAVTLGKVVEIKDNGDTLTIRYYYLTFTLNKNKITKIIRDMNSELYYVSEEEKDRYDQIHMKLVV